MDDEDRNRRAAYPGCIALILLAGAFFALIAYLLWLVP
jgi:hypothetical protein